MGCLCSNPQSQVTPTAAEYTSTSAEYTPPVPERVTVVRILNEKESIPPPPLLNKPIQSTDCRIQAQHELGLFIPCYNCGSLSHLIPLTLHRLYHTENLQEFEKLREGGDDNDLCQLCQSEHEKGNLSATNNYAWMLLFGMGCTRNFVKATELFQYASRHGNLTAKNNTIVCSYIGFGDGTEESSIVLQKAIASTTSYQRALWLHGDAADFTFPHRDKLHYMEYDFVHPLSPYLTIPFGGPLPKPENDCIMEFQKLVDSGHCRIAICNLASCGVNTDRNYERAAREGCTQAQFYQGLSKASYLEIETLAEKDNLLTLGYLSKGAFGATKFQFQGMEFSCGDSLCGFTQFEKKYGTSDSDRKAQEIFAQFQTAAYQGSVQAQRELKECYLSSYGTKQEHAESVLWLIQAAEHGCAESAFLVGRIYEAGQCRLLALQWYHTASQRGHSPAEAAIQSLRT
jgi:TPR repeat protein